MNSTEFQISDYLAFYEAERADKKAGNRNTPGRNKCSGWTSLDLQL